MKQWGRSPRVGHEVSVSENCSNTLMNAEMAARVMISLPLHRTLSILVKNDPVKPPNTLPKAS